MTTSSEDLSLGFGVGAEARDKSVPWYKTDIGEIPKLARELLEKYSGIPPDSVVSHIYKVRDLAWEIDPYPCIGGATFLQLGISQTPFYPEIISRVQNGEHLLDVGCCLGQDIRRIVFDGAPSENIYGTDLHGALMEVGYDLFLDRGKLRTTFIAADIFNPSSALVQLHGQFDIIYAGSFLHLFDWETQVAAAKQFVTLLRPKKGVLIIGQGFGHLDADLYPVGPNSSRRIYKHNPQSFTRMWKQVGVETGTSWEVSGQLEVMNLAGFSKTGQWGDPNSRLLRFSVCMN
ncbi:MAG: hypothetical protein M1812_008122 [Candelaria pacifica]|nr:MAG: hypothetical protein M1812_008122 [Candelaria pacifica]